ncbi:MAG: hypothetical protein AAF604_12370 [Acidobacteriota bacterium]
MLKHLPAPENPVRVFIFLALFVAFGSTSVWAVGGAIQTISSGGKENTFTAVIEERTMMPDMVLDNAARMRLCSDGAPLDAMDCAAYDGGLDHVAAGTGLRNTGYGTIRLRGFPPAGKPVLARLVWGRILGTGDDPMAGKNRLALLDGVELEGRLLGTTNSPCWDEAKNFAAYFAPVPLQLLSPSVNGDYRIDLFGSLSTDGGDLFDTGRLPPLDEGASLVVVFSDPSLPRESLVYFHFGPELLIGDLVLDQPLEPKLPTTVERFRQTRIGADGQRAVPSESVLPYRTLFGTRQELAVLRGPDSKIDPTTDWNGDDANPLNGMWDTHSNSWNSRDTPSLVGAESYRMRYKAVEPEIPPLPPEERQTAVPEPVPVSVWLDCVAVIGHLLTAY